MSTSNRPQIYLAGPDVFFPDAEARFDRLDALCDARGMQGLRPSDAGMSALAANGVPPQEIARQIYQANVEHIRNCDAVVANMMPFRGDIEPDSGTVFEVGMAIALGKPVALYLPQGIEASGPRIKRICGEDHGKGGGIDVRFGAYIEDFGLPLNLMLAVPAPAYKTPQEALDNLAEQLAHLIHSEAAPRKRAKP
jgi:nucleoside 2-deoxyribosyltransferase